VAGSGDKVPFIGFIERIFERLHRSEDLKRGGQTKTLPGLHRRMVPLVVKAKVKYSKAQEARNGTAAIVVNKGARRGGSKEGGPQEPLAAG